MKAAIRIRVIRMSHLDQLNRFDWEITKSIENHSEYPSGSHQPTEPVESFEFETNNLNATESHESNESSNPDHPASAEQNLSQGAKRVAYIISVRNSTCSFICQSFCLSLLCASRDPLFLCKFLITSELRCFSISSRRALEFCDSHLTVMKIWEINAQRS